MRPWWQIDLEPWVRQLMLVAILALVGALEVEVILLLLKG